MKEKDIIITKLREALSLALQYVPVASEDPDTQQEIDKIYELEKSVCLEEEIVGLTIVASVGRGWKPVSITKYGKTPKEKK